MRPITSKKRIRTPMLTCAGSVLALAVVSGNVRLLVPEESPGGPFYARIEAGLIYHTEDWAAIAFYRDPGCVPAEFDLLEFFDFANIPAIFGCPLTVHGFEIWKNGPGVDPAPIQSKLRGNGAVPVWFVSWSELQTALPGITKTELLGLPSLMMGTASYFDETLHPTGGAQQSVLRIVAMGLLPDGRSFLYETTGASGTIRQVKIEFK